MEKLEKDFQAIYDSMHGYLKKEYRIPWVKNVWEEETGFKLAYDDFWTVREHLCQRYGIDWDDEDLERIMNGIMNLDEDLCRRMFQYTIEYAKRGYQL